MSKPFPGPWQSEYNGYYYGIRPFNDRSGKPGFFTGIATVQAGEEHQYEYALTPEEAKATTRLITAAPDMYEALIQARGALRLDAMVDESGKHYGTTEVALHLIDEAIRKAEGGD